MSDNVTEKVYCYEKPDNSTMLAAMMNGGYNNQWNNPMMYLVWMWMMRWMNGGEGNANARDIQTLQNTIADNHNSDLIMAGINGNTNAIREAATTMGCDFNALNMAVQNVRAGIDQVAGQVGFSSERVINAVQSGDSGVIQAVKDCCCNTQKAIIDANYQNQLANCQQTNTLVKTINDANYQQLDRMRDLGNGIAQGFASTAYDTQRQTCDIINAISASQQKTSDLLNGHWRDELAGKLQDAKFEVSQLKQNQYIASLINNGGNSGCGCGCSI